MYTHIPWIEVLPTIGYGITYIALFAAVAPYGNRLYSTNLSPPFLNCIKFPTEEKVANINCFIKSTYLRHVAIFC